MTARVPSTWGYVLLGLAAAASLGWFVVCLAVAW